MNIGNFLKHNWFAIFYFNFKMLPFKQAIFLPFDFYNSIRFKCLSGKVFLSTNKIKTGMIKIGAQGSEMFPTSCFIMDIKGNLFFGGKSSIGCGGLIKIGKSGKIIIDDGVVLGAYNKVICEDSIVIGEGTITSWKCQIMDTDTHSIKDTKTGIVHKRYKSIKIGNKNWIGNNVMINKGTVTPNKTIIASCSLCNKDYSKNIEEYSIIGGYPAKLLINHKERCNDKFDSDETKVLDISE